MDIAANVVIGLVAALHLYFLVLEMFLWRTPKGLATFGMTAEQAEATATLAANQGLYNGFLAAGLVWALLASEKMGEHAALFFLGCVTVAGVYGAATVNKRILFVQALPAVVGIVLVLAAR
ncbi:MAG TPA: DUF1304 domain-containing protein [Mycobacteriales bacterium]|nr:DUF1304 domain-containing protein [Mycobacteriales bacterium]